MDKLEILAMRLKEVRETLKMSQSDFSESIGLKQQTYSAYEKGINKPPIDILINIAEKYNVSIDWLCGFSNLKKKEIRLDTYADVLHLLFELGFLDGVDLDTNFAKWNKSENNFDADYSNLMMIYINDTTINNALQEWKKMFDLFKSDIIDEEVYRLWMEKTLTKHTSFYSADKNVYRPYGIDFSSNPELPFT